MRQNTSKTDLQPALSLSFAEVGRLRVRPAEFARMVSVSRQTVSQWIAQGKVTLGADGRLDPSIAAGQVVRNSDPTRLRARVLKEAVQDSASLRRRVAELEAALAAARARLAFLEEFSDNCIRAEDLLLAELANDAALDVLRSITDRTARLRYLEEMRDRADIRAEGRDPDNLPSLEELAGDAMPPAGLPALDDDDEGGADGQ